MLSYRHGFHAGNHADVLKHAVLLELLAYLQRKDGGISCVDTHAGAIDHALDSDFAQKNREYETGVARIWGATPRSELLQRYRQAIADHNPDGILRRYPGSPALMDARLRPQDRLRLFELHPTEAADLSAAFAGRRPPVVVTRGDGLAGLRAALPPTTPRALVLIDPAYENKRDFRGVVDALRESLRRFATGVYMVWYPLLPGSDTRQLPSRLRRLQPSAWLDVQLSVRRPNPAGYGMHGSGVFVINPPWTLPAQLQAALPEMLEYLAQDDRAGHRLQHRID